MTVFVTQVTEKFLFKFVLILPGELFLVIFSHLRTGNDFPHFFSLEVSVKLVYCI